jgi:exodeoxyribonuclease I
MTLFHDWYDTETTGANPRYDQVLQAAAILTDDDFVEIDWIDERSRLAGHMIPSAGALKVTHVDPYDIARAKHSSFEFARMLHNTFATWATKGELSYSGFNTIRFDEEIVRQMFWENLLDPYLSSGKGTYRNDLLTVVRSLYARNPECIEVPKIEETGKNSFKLEKIAPLNGFQSHNAHDALGDVRATIFLGRLIRDTDRALWEHMLALGNAKTATNFVEQTVVFQMLGGPMLNPGVLDCCLIASEATNNKSKSAWNLAVDPTPYLDLSPAEIVEKMRQPGTPFRSVKCNKQPAVFPMGWEFMNRVTTEEFAPADPDLIDQRSQIIQEHAGFKANVAEALRIKTESYDAPKTLEEKIYAGFPSWDDKARMKDFHAAATWEQRLEIVRTLENAEMRALGIRAVYLNSPQTLSETLREQCAIRIAEERHGLALDKPWNTVGTLMAEVDEMLAADPEDEEVLNIKKWALETYPSASQWTGVPEETVVQADAETPETVTPAPDPVVPAAPQAIVRQVEAAAVHFLDGLV